MKKWIALTIITLTIAGCRPRPAPADESVASSYYHPYGFALSKEEWASHGKSGKVVSNLKGGRVETVTYEDGVRHGLMELTFPYSTLVARSCVYDKGRLVQETDHYSTGAPKSQTNFLSDGIKEVSAWYPDGVPQAQETWQNDHLEEGKYFNHDGSVLISVSSGSGKRYEFDGATLSAKEQYVAGLVILREDVYPNGQVSIRTPYEAGKAHGVVERYDQKGAIIFTEEWVNGDRQGKVIEYLNGEKIAEIPFVQGKKNGVEKRFRARELVETIEWVNDKKFGPHKMYARGEVVKEEYYYHDNPVTKVTFQKLVL